MSNMSKNEGVKSKPHCNICDKHFCENFSLHRHLRNVHGIVIVKCKQFECEYCTRSYAARKDLLSHLRKEHPNLDAKKRAYRFNVRCPDCSKLFRGRRLLRAHVALQHGVQIKEEEKTFKSRDEFDCWKREVEKEDETLYARITGAKKFLNKSGKWREYYACHRSGTFVPGGAGKRNLKKSGSCKIGSTCTASMTIICTDSEIHVSYCRSHFGHGSDPPISKDTLRRWKGKWSDPKRSGKIVNENGEILTKPKTDCVDKNDDNLITIQDKTVEIPSADVEINASEIECDVTIQVDDEMNINTEQDSDGENYVSDYEEIISERQDLDTEFLFKNGDDKLVAPAVTNVFSLAETDNVNFHANVSPNIELEKVDTKNNDHESNKSQLLERLEKIYQIVSSRKTSNIEFSCVMDKLDDCVFILAKK